MTLPDLIAALEAAQGPSRELDLVIGEAIGAKMSWSGDIVGLGYARYTTSLDDALSLVPEGAVWRIAILTDYELPGRASIYDIKDGHDSYHVRADARSPALALCIAALRARLSAAKEGE